MTARRQRYAYLALSLVFCLWALRNWLKTLQQLRRFYTNIQIWDSFDWVSRYDRYRHFDLSVLWIQHNEHRDVVAEILFAADMLLFHGRQIMPTVSGVAAYLATIAIFVTIAFYAVEDSRPIWCGALLVTMLAGYKLCVVSLTIPFLITWPQWEFFGAASLVAASLHPRRGGTLLLILSIVFAVAATYSMANGMLLWPVLFAAALLLRFSKRHCAAIAVCGAIAAGTYFIGYHNMHSLSLSNALSHPVYLARFLGVLLGMPFSLALGFSNMLRSSCYGWLAIAIAMADLVWIVRKRLWMAPPVVVMGGYSILTLASAFVTAAGRMDVIDPYFQAARAGRYYTEPMLFWCALLMLTVWLLREAFNGYAPLVLVVAIARMASITLPETEEYYNWWERYFARGQWAAIALANGVVDQEIAGVIYPDPNYVTLTKHVLIDNHLAEFADPEPWWIGRKATDLFARGSDGWVHGDITAIKKRGPNFEIQGWAEGATKVIFTGENGRVVGFAVRPTAGVDQLYTNDVSPPLAFTGFIRGEFGEKTFSAWALDRTEHQMFRLGTLRNPLPAL